MRNVSARIVDPGMQSTQYSSKVADWLLAFSSLRFAPCPGSLDGRHGNRQEFVRLSRQWFHHVHLRYSAFDKQLHPIRGFIQFFFNQAHLCDEVTGGSGTAGSSVVSAHGGSGTQKLPTEHISDASSGQGFHQPDNSQCKKLRPTSQILLSHLRHPPRHSAIRIPQSKMVPDASRGAVGTR